MRFLFSAFTPKLFSVNNSEILIPIEEQISSMAHPEKEFLRSYCENFFKCHGDCSYFRGTDPLCDHLDQELIKTFVVDHEFLILVFQPYTVGGCVDVPFTVKIPFTELIGKWQAGNSLEKHLPITKNFLSSWDKDDWISDVQEDHSIAYQKDTVK